MTLKIYINKYFDYNLKFKFSKFHIKVFNLYFRE